MIKRAAAGQILSLPVFLLSGRITEDETFKCIHTIIEGNGGMIIGIFDELDKAMKKVGEEVKKADLDKNLSSLERGISTAEKNVKSELEQSKKPEPPPSPAPGPQKTFHHGYSRITAWVRQKYKGRIPKKTDPFQTTLELEMMLQNEACKDLPDKTKKGFLAYLKHQKYEDLFR